MSPFQMNPPTSPMASVFNTPPEFKSFLPKSLSTGSFRGQESSMMIKIPEEDVIERDSSMYYNNTTSFIHSNICPFILFYLSIKVLQLNLSNKII